MVSDAAEISGFVLAGGRSSRLGRDKALLPWPPREPADANGPTLLQHSIDRLQSVCSAVSVCANRSDLPFAGAVIPDALPGSGPLGGIVAALENSTTDWNLILAVDLPFLPVEVLQVLVGSARSATPFQSRSTASIGCILPQIDGRPQPLCGLYHRALRPGLHAALRAGNLKVMAALQQACEAVPAGLLDPSGRRKWRVELWDAAAYAAKLPAAPDAREWFLNINTMEDWKQASHLRSR